MHNRTFMYIAIARQWSLIWTTLLLTLQQIIVAMSTILLAKAASSLEDISKFQLYFSIYVISLIAPYLPGILSQYFLQIWKAKSFRLLQTKMIERSSYKPSDYYKHETENERVALFANSAQTSVNFFCDYVYELASSTMNSLFSIFAVSAIINKDVLIAYGFSVILCIIYFKLFYGKASVLSSQVEEYRVNLISVAQKVWPNLILNNRRSHANWISNLSDAHTRYLKHLAKASSYKLGSSFFLSMISILPIIMVTLYTALSTPQNVSFLSEIAVTTPRVFQIAAMLSFAVSLCFSMSDTFGRLSVLSRFVETDSSDQPFPINLHGISVRHDTTVWQPDSVDEFVSRISQPGRYLVSGANGTGKTSLLLQTKEKLRNNAFFLPASSDIELPGKDYKGSMGQRKKSEIEALLHDAREKVLLLDEWDANLDTPNAHLVSAMLDSASQAGVSIVEVRHRRD